MHYFCYSVINHYRLHQSSCQESSDTTGPRRNEPCIRVNKKLARDDSSAIKVKFHLYYEKRGLNIPHWNRTELKNYIRRNARTMYCAHTVSNPFPSTIYDSIYCVSVITVVGTCCYCTAYRIVSVALPACVCSEQLGQLALTAPTRAARSRRSRVTHSGKL